jgi:putative addiction module component (TIGR02574 family)
MSHELREELLKLSVAERLELVQELWDSIAAECEREPLPLTDEQRQDLLRRLAEADADPASGIPWEEVRKRIRHRQR